MGSNSGSESSVVRQMHAKGMACTSLGFKPIFTPIIVLESVPILSLSRLRCSLVIMDRVPTPGREMRACILVLSSSRHVFLEIVLSSRLRTIIPKPEIELGFRFISGLIQFWIRVIL